MLVLLLGAVAAVDGVGRPARVPDVRLALRHQHANGMRSAGMFGALVPIYGTLVTSAIALIIAVPVSFGIALFLTEIAPRWTARPGRHRDRAARRHPEHHLRHVGPVRVRAVHGRARRAVADDHLGNRPIVGALFSGPPIGIGMLTAGIVLGIMVIPFISSVAREVFNAVPAPLKESAFALGSTRWEVLGRVTCRTRARR